MRRQFRHSTLAAILTVGCAGSSGSTTPTSDDSDIGERTIDLRGTARKGPFLPGTEVRVYELDAALAQTGRSFTATITSEDGTWEVPGVTLANPIALVVVDGTTKDERAEDAVLEARLSALVDTASVTQVAINVASHIERPRIESLVRGGSTFSIAALQSHQELHSGLGWPAPASPAHQVDVADGTADGRWLLLLSLLMMERSADVVGGFPTLLAQWAEDLDDGSLDAEARTDLLATAAALVAPIATPTCPLEEATDRLASWTRAAASDLDVWANLTDWLRTCPGGHLDCTERCVPGETIAEATARVAAGPCDAPHACATFQWDGAACTSLEPRTDPSLVWLDAVFCTGDRLFAYPSGAQSFANLWMSLGSKLLADLIPDTGEDYDFDVDHPTPLPPELHAALVDFWDSCADGTAEPEFPLPCDDSLDDLLGFPATQPWAQLCLDGSAIGNGTCDAPFAQPAFGFDGGDCLPLPSIAYGACASP